MGDVFIKLRYEERDIANALRLRMTTSLRKRPEIALAAVACGVGCILTYLYAPAGPVRVLVVALPATVLALVASVLVFLPKIMFRRRQSFHVPMTIDASDEGITVTAGGSARTIAWPDCERIETDRRMCVIHHGDEMLLVPRRAFRNVQRESAFFDLVRAHASREKRRFDSGKSMPIASP